MNLLFRTLIPALFLFSVSCAKEDKSSPEAKAFFQEAHARVVWLQDRGDNRDVFADGNDLVLMGWDSRKGTRELIQESQAYAKPLITPDGKTVIYTLRNENTTYALDWKKGKSRKLTHGWAVDTWQDPKNGKIWVILGRHPTPRKVFSEIARVSLDRKPKEETLIQNLTFLQDGVQMTYDGSRVTGLFPWPKSGMVDLESGSFTQYGKGCWASLAPGDRDIMWTFDGPHRNLIMDDVRSGREWMVSLAEAPNLGGTELYHPRWSHHPHFIAVTGPYKHKAGTNNIRGGGADVEVLLGRFSTDLEQVDAWYQLTDNDRADFYPDLWVEGGEDAEVNVKQASGPAVQPEQSEVATLKVRLVEQTALPTSIDPPYTRALIENHYEVLAPAEFAEKEILILRWGFLPEDQPKPVARKLGETYELKVLPWKQGKILEGERVVSDVEAFTLPRFVELETVELVK